jgi:hypothetical protein
VGARRLLAAGDCFCVDVDLTWGCVSTRLYLRLFPLFCALFFPIVFFLAFSMTFPVFARSDAV